MGAIALAPASRAVLDEWGARPGLELWTGLETEPAEVLKNLQDQALRILSTARESGREEDWKAAEMAFRHLNAAHLDVPRVDDIVRVLRAMRELGEQIIATREEAEASQDVSQFGEAAKLLRVSMEAFEGRNDPRGQTKIFWLHGRVLWSIADLQREYPETRIGWLREAVRAFERGVAVSGVAQGEVDAELLAKLWGTEAELVRGEMKHLGLSMTFARGLALLNLAHETKDLEDFEAGTSILRGLVPECVDQKLRAQVGKECAIGAHHLAMLNGSAEWWGVQTVVFRDAAADFRGIGDVANEAVCSMAEASGAAELAKKGEVSRWRQAFEAYQRAGKIFVSIDDTQRVEAVNAFRDELTEDFKAAGAPGEELDKSPEIPVQEEVTTDQEEERIADDSAAVETTVNAGADFTGAVGALKSRLIPSVTDQDIAELEAVIREAQQNPPADKPGFVRDMRRMLEAGGLELQVEGEPNRVKLTMKNGSIALAISRKGTVGFHGRAVLHVVRVDGPEFSSWTDPKQSAQALER